MDDKLDASKSDVKQVVNTLVGKQVERLEKIDHNQQTTNTNIKNLEKQMDGKFATMESNLLKAIQDCKDATPAPPAPSGSPGPSGAGGSSSRYDSRPGVAMALSPPFINDVTTPQFNRAPDATKLYCNIHDRVQVARNQILQTKCWCWLPKPDSMYMILFFGTMHWNSALRCSFQETHVLLRSKPSNFMSFLSWEEASGNHNLWNVPQEKKTSLTLIQTRIQAKPAKKFWQNVSKPFLSPMRSGKDFFIKKSSGTLYNDRRAVVSVVLTGEESARLEWCHPKCIGFKIVQEDVEAAFSHYVVAGGQSS